MSRVSPPPLHAHWQGTVLGDEAVFELLLPVSWVPSLLELQLELLHHLTYDCPHLMHRERLPNAVRWSVGERHERVWLVREVRRRREETFGYLPALGPEPRRVAEVARVSMDGVEVQTGVTAFRDEALERQEPLGYTFS